MLLHKDIQIPHLNPLVGMGRAYSRRQPQLITNVLPVHFMAQALLLQVAAPLQLLG